MEHFIVVEGMDGVGKTTLIHNCILPYFQSVGVTCTNIVTLPENFKDIALTLKEDNRIAELLLILSARAVAINSLNAKIQKGCSIVADRFDWSTLVIQMLGCTTEQQTIYDTVTEYGPTPLIEPFYFLLDTDRTIVNKRLGRRGKIADKYEHVPDILWNRQRKEYKNLASKNFGNSIVLDASQENIYQQTSAVLNRLLHN